MAKKNSDLIPGAKNLKALRGALEHSVTIQMTRLQDVVDDLVSRGSLSRTDADKLIDQLVSTSKAYTHALLEVLETVRVETRKNLEAGLSTAAAPVMATANKLVDTVRKGKGQKPGKKGKDKLGKTGKKGKAKAGAADAKLTVVQHDPIPDLADLSIAKIRPLLAALTPAELRQVRAREATGKGRTSLLAEIDRSLKS
ncbi:MULTISPECIES: hypothetical protein [unclassified Nocardioides]|uniref:hypothetical protein n=1 Tax=unclassified Nocardioides TaxID=2615069 RepID=UPI0006F3FF5D|nr:MULTISPECIES: hypothetical protein [unclassified Nocardioides]KRA27243.1 hypothetical protein ASD81_24445 [Nocardioides sp. Root614]KRA91119.1 hypothetical protein ASD84_00145 [Nocardioides sp. Root682]